jgi:hypothetical protein
MAYGQKRPIGQVYASGKTKQYGTFSRVELFEEFKFVNIMVILL